MEATVYVDYIADCRQAEHDPRSVSVEQIGGIFLGKTDRKPTFVY